MFRNSRTENIKLTKLQPLRSNPPYNWKYGSLNHDRESRSETKNETDRVIFGPICPDISQRDLKSPKGRESPKMGIICDWPCNFHLRTVPDRANIDVHDRVDLYFYLNSSVYRPSCLDLWPFKFTLEILLPDFWLAHQSKFDFEICNFKC